MHACPLAQDVQYDVVIGKLSSMQSRDKSHQLSIHGSIYFMRKYVEYLFYVVGLDRCCRPEEQKCYTNEKCKYAKCAKGLPARTKGGLTVRPAILTLNTGGKGGKKRLLHLARQLSKGDH